MQWRLKNYRSAICDLLSEDFGLDRLEAELLLSFVTGLRREFIIAHPELTIEEEKIKAFHQMVLRRLKGEPLAYLIGRKEFFSIPLFVDRRCFIPRPETETLVECAIRFNPHPSSKVLDLGTGSGAIAIAFSMNSPYSEVYASDISIDALMVAERNVKNYGLERVFLVNGDCFSPFKREAFDIILSNPPYLSELEFIQNPSLHFEPFSSLVAGKEGYEFIGRILKEGFEYVKKGGYIMIEMGYGQIERIVPEIRGRNFWVVKDLSGIDRVLILRK